MCIRPWRVYLVSGAALDQLKSALVAAAGSGSEPNIPPLPRRFAGLRSELGRDVYGVGVGIGRDDVLARKAAVLRNFDFFGAPVAAIVCMDRSLSSADAVAVGVGSAALQSVFPPSCAGHVYLPMYLGTRCSR